MTASTRIVLGKTGALRVSRELHKEAMNNCEPPIEIGSREEYLFLSGAFGGEAGELQNEIKKVARDGMTPERLKKIKGEVGDVVAYLLHVCDVFGINKEACFTEKVNQVINDKGREWTGGLFDRIVADPSAYNALVVREDSFDASDSDA